METNINWEVIAVVLSALGVLMTWMNRKFDKIDDHVSEAHKRIDATNERVDAMGARIDAMGARIDTTQAIIMRMLEKKGM